MKTTTVKEAVVNTPLWNLVTSADVQSLSRALPAYTVNRLIGHIHMAIVAATVGAIVS